ncbi:MAG: hypothetical protein APR63_09340 [Desulfuromonas sp. SDB]|nr:MAG: hypothetical protein APR63_09340 [Desulfuromonas sp. SDB]
MKLYVTSPQQLDKKGINSKPIMSYLYKNGLVVEADSLPSSPEFLRQKILAELSAEVSSVVIIGNHQVIPFFPLDNPTVDSDAEVWSDNPYVCLYDDFLLPDYPISRIPSDPHNPLFLWDYLENCKVEVEVSQKVFGISAHSWKNASREVFSLFPDKHKQLLFSPPLIRLSLPVHLVESNYTYRYFNVHGSKHTHLWYGQQGSNYPAVLSSEDIIDQKGVVVISEACYGGWLAKRGEKTSIAMKFLLSGASLFLGSTTISYGPSYPPSEEADLICGCFVQQLRKQIPAATALLKAREEFINLTVSRQGYLDDDDRKSLYQFVLYGNPDIIVKERF